MILNSTLSRAGPGSKSRATLALFSTVKTGLARFTETRAAGVLTHRAAGVALSSTRLYAALVAV